VSTTASRKAKGRRLQQRIRDDLRKLGKGYRADFKDGDCESRPMGCCGTDVVLSPMALGVFPFDIEAKNCESLNVSTTFWEHYGKYTESKRLKMLIHAKNHTEPTVTMRWTDFLKVYDAWAAERSEVTF
jgi:hypothetical protein